MSLTKLLASLNLVLVIGVAISWIHLEASGAEYHLDRLPVISQSAVAQIEGPFLHPVESSLVKQARIGYRSIGQKLSWRQQRIYFDTKEILNTSDFDLVLSSSLSNKSESDCVKLIILQLVKEEGLIQKSKPRLILSSCDEDDGSIEL